MRKRRTYERCEFFFTSYFVTKTENDNPNVSIQEEYYLPHDPWEGNFDLSYAQFENNDHDEFKNGFNEPPLDTRIFHSI
jgi:hypothetical protein